MMVRSDDILQRCELLLGEDAMQRLAAAHVIIFGVGGVGSWCAESLVRTGVMHLTLVDFDTVSVSNINRQLMATTATVGQVKTNVLRQRLMEINPAAEIQTIHAVYTPETRDSFGLENYDVVIDAIDSLKDKADLILTVTRLRHTMLVSSMGAALKLDPTRIHVDEFWHVQGDPLARALRQRFKREKQFPARKFRCVYSDELLPNKGVSTENLSTLPIHKTQINGTVAHVTAIFGFMLAGEVIKYLTQKPIRMADE